MNHKPNHPKRNPRDPEAIAFARQQRTTANEFASTIWQMLRNRNCRGQKFRREYPIPPYTLGFCCVALKLVIEIDGEHHLTEEGQTHDKRRDEFLRDRGYQVLRIAGFDVVRDLAAVMRLIEQTIDTRIDELENPSPPAPLP